MSWPQDLGIHGKWHQNTGNVWIKSTGTYRQFRKVLLFYGIFCRFDPSALSFPVVLLRPRLYSHRSVCRCSTWCNYTDNRTFWLLSLFGTVHGKSCRNAAGNSEGVPKRSENGNSEHCFGSFRTACTFSDDAWWQQWWHQFPLASGPKLCHYDACLAILAYLHDSTPTKRTQLTIYPKGMLACGFYILLFTSWAISSLVILLCDNGNR